MIARTLINDGFMNEISTKADALTFCLNPAVKCGLGNAELIGKFLKSGSLFVGQYKKRLE
jgi:hypothetical protein